MRLQQVTCDGCGLKVDQINDSDIGPMAFGPTPTTPPAADWHRLAGTVRVEVDQMAILEDAREQTRGSFEELQENLQHLPEHIQHAASAMLDGLNQVASDLAAEAPHSMLVQYELDLCPSCVERAGALIRGAAHDAAQRQGLTPA